MKDRAYRYLPIAILGFALLVLLPALAAADESGAPAFPARTSAKQLTPRNVTWLESVTKAACHGNVSCQPNYPSCASWSPYSSCGTPRCLSLPGCGESCEFGPCRGPAWLENVESFRVCFDQWGNSCTEWTTTSFYSCGC